MAPSALFNGYRRSSPMSQQHFDASRSLTALEQDSTIIAVIEMSQSKWLVSALVPGVERHPLKKLDAQEEVLLKLLQRWRTEARQAGREIKRIVVAYEAGRDGFWLARWLRARDIEAYVIQSHEHCSVARTPAREDRSPRHRTADARLSWLVAQREAPLQHGGNPDDRGGGRAAEP
jgi:transposase